MPSSLSNRSTRSFYGDKSRRRMPSLSANPMATLQSLLDDEPNVVGSSELISDFFDNLPASVQLPEQSLIVLKNHMASPEFSESPTGRAEFVGFEKFMELASVVKKIIKPSSGGSRGVSKVSSQLQKTEDFLTKAYNSIAYVDYTYDLHLPAFIRKTDDDELTQHLDSLPFLGRRINEAFHLLTRQTSLTLRTSHYIGKILYGYYALTGKCPRRWKELCTVVDKPDSTLRRFRDFYVFVHKYPLFMRTNLSMSSVYSWRLRIEKFFDENPAVRAVWEQSADASDVMNTSPSMKQSFSANGKHVNANLDFTRAFWASQMGLPATARHVYIPEDKPEDKTAHKPVNPEANSFQEIPASAIAEQVRQEAEEQVFLARDEDDIDDDDDFVDGDDDDDNIDFLLNEDDDDEDEDDDEEEDMDMEDFDEDVLNEALALDDAQLSARLSSASISASARS